MSFDLVNAPDSTPFSCFCGTGGQAPFVRTSIARPGGGVYFICATCARRIMSAYGGVLKADADALQEQLRAANEHLGEFAAAVTRGDVLQAELTNLEAELAMVRSENILLTTTVAEQQRDMEDLENGVMRRSRVSEGAAEVFAEVAAETVEREQKPARKPRTAA
jgi:hypothetical protein